MSQLQVLFNSPPEKVTADKGKNKFPVALASHEDVVKDSTLFHNTLRSFHFALGSKLSVPVIGGKELNLHVLYVEVTKRGGYDKVVSEKKWREIGTVFQLAPTTTSASYALRKHYQTLLLSYEMIYFFRLDDPKLKQKEKEVPTTFQTVGVIDGKFDSGYLVSVKVGDKMLKGVLYHTGDQSAPAAPPGFPAIAALSGNSAPAAAPPGYPAAPPPPASLPQPVNSIVPYQPQAQPQPQAQGRRIRKRRAGDPRRPKPNRSGYNFYFAEKHSALKALYPNREREFTKMIGNAWTNLSEEEKLVYQKYGEEDKERYQRELEEYKEKEAMEAPEQPSSSTVVVALCAPNRNA